MRRGQLRWARPRTEFDGVASSSSGFPALNGRESLAPQASGGRLQPQQYLPVQWARRYRLSRYLWSAGHAREVTDAHARLVPSARRCSGVPA
jgi:hypothetical protein